MYLILYAHELDLGSTEYPVQTRECEQGEVRMWVQQARAQESAQSLVERAQASERERAQAWERELKQEPLRVVQALKRVKEPVLAQDSDCEKEQAMATGQEREPEPMALVDS